MPKITVYGGPSNGHVESEEQEEAAEEVEPTAPDDAEEAEKDSECPEGDDYSAWPYKELLAELKRRDMPRGGITAELAQRLADDDARAKG